MATQRDAHSLPASALIQISLVMPIHGPLQHSRPALAALSALSPRPVHVIVVADVPVPTEELAWLPESTLLLQVPFQSGPAVARNLGAAAATGDIVCFVDSDVVIPPGTLRRIQELFASDPGLSAVFGSYDADPGDTGFLSQYRNLLHHYVHQHGREEASTFWAGLGAVRLAPFRALGGFDPSFAVPSIEDIELGCRLSDAGHRIRLVKDLQGKHLKKWTVANLLRTDLFRRGIPWTRLILRRQRLTGDLSVDRTARLSTLACAVALGSLVIALWFPAALLATGLSLASMIGINRRFYAFVARTRSPWFALWTIPWHAVFYVQCGLAALMGTVLHYRDQISAPRVSNV